MSDESQFLSVIRVWAALAWADGHIADAERAAMRRLIEGASELTDDERETALGWLEEKVDLDTTNVAGIKEDARKGIYRAAARLAAVDLEIAEEERTFLERLRSGLQIDEEAAKEIEDSIPGMKS